MVELKVAHTWGSQAAFYLATDQLSFSMVATSWHHTQSDGLQYQKKAPGPTEGEMIGRRERQPDKDSTLEVAVRYIKQLLQSLITTSAIQIHFITEQPCPRYLVRQERTVCLKILSLRPTWCQELPGSQVTCPSFSILSSLSMTL